MFDKDAKTQIMVLSEHQQQLFTQYYGTQAERFHLLPPGIARASAARPMLPRSAPVYANSAC